MWETIALIMTEAVRELDRNQLLGSSSKPELDITVLLKSGAIRFKSKTPLITISAEGPVKKTRRSSCPISHTDDGVEVKFDRLFVDEPAQAFQTVGSVEVMVLSLTGTTTVGKNKLTGRACLLGHRPKYAGKTLNSLMIHNQRAARPRPRFAHRVRIALALQEQISLTNEQD